MRHFFIFLLVCFAAISLAYAEKSHANPVVTGHAIASLVSEAEEIMPGEPFWAAVRLELEEGWHIYWKNPGDSGLAPEIHWKTPNGFTVGDIHWQPPHVIAMDTLINYGYEDEAWLLVPVTAPGYVNKSYTFILSAEVSWLICKDICIPESASLTLPLKVTDGGTHIPSTYADNIRGQLKTLPEPVTDVGVYGQHKDKLLFNITLPEKGNYLHDLQSARFFPTDQGIIDNISEHTLKRSGNTLQIAVKRGALAPPEHLEGILSLYGSDASQGKHFYVTLELGAVKEHIKSLNTEGLWQILLFALLGGIILNAMPCVFPVLSLKTLSIAKNADSEPAKIKLQGIAYTAGILLCFAILSGILIALQQGGEKIGWGFQLQSPVFVTAMAYLFFLVGLSLSGIFHLPVLFGNAAAKIGNNDGAYSSFFTGILAALVATPCTAPFMAPAIGFALTQPPVAALVIFLTLGFGLALPYLLLSWFPPLLHLLPKPGAWMETLKQFLAFPMYASAAWLLWVLTQQTGSSGLAYALSGIVVLAFGIWVVTHIRPSQRSYNIIVFALIILPIFATLYLQLPQDDTESSAQIDRNAVTKPFSPHRLEVLRSQGKAVFVNTTADWCITCKANEQLALSSDRFWRVFAEKEITYLEADWTNRDADIASYLKSFGRDGVPLYVYYPPDGGEPVILPQLLLGPSAVLDVIDDVEAKHTQEE